MAIAILKSVTVSIAADTIGTCKVISLVNFEDMFTSLGSTPDLAGTRRTSSNVRPSRTIWSKSVLLVFCCMADVFELRYNNLANILNSAQSSKTYFALSILSLSIESSS